MYRIEKEFAFEAAHHLPHLPPGHQCRRPHGHSYRVVMVLEADDLDPSGFVRDYGDLEAVKAFLAREWDHRDLNAIAPGLGPIQTTAEHMARWLFERFCAVYPELTEVRVSETQKTWAIYRPSP